MLALQCCSAIERTHVWYLFFGELGESMDSGSEDTLRHVIRFHIMSYHVRSCYYMSSFIIFMSSATVIVSSLRMVGVITIVCWLWRLGQPEQQTTRHPKVSRHRVMRWGSRLLREHGTCHCGALLHVILHHLRPVIAYQSRRILLIHFSM